MTRPRAERRMVREGEPPSHAVGAGLERCLEKLPMLRQHEQAVASEERFFRGVDADELDVRAVPEPVKESRTERRPSRRFFPGQALAQVEVVFHLRAVVARLALVGVVIADGGVYRNPV